jgi:hypothetical protein
VVHFRVITILSSDEDLLEFMVKVNEHCLLFVSISLKN